MIYLLSGQSAEKTISKERTILGEEITKEVYRLSRVYLTSFDQRFMFLKQFKEDNGEFDYSERTLAELDEAVVRFIADCEKESELLVSNFKEEIILLQESLLKEERVTINEQSFQSAQ